MLEASAASKISSLLFLLFAGSRAPIFAQKMCDRMMKQNNYGRTARAARKFEKYHFAFSASLLIFVSSIDYDTSMSLTIPPSLHGPCYDSKQRSPYFDIILSLACPGAAWDLLP